jgi:hypothetical protein
MSNILNISIPYKQPLNGDRITDDLVTTLYDLLPNKISFWAVKLAQANFNERQGSGRATWLDKMQVYVGLPDWVVDEQQMHVEAMPHLKCPFGLLETLSEITEISVNCAIPFRQTDTLTRKPYDAFLHTYTFEAKLQSMHLEDDIEGKENDLVDHDSQHGNLVIKACDHVCAKRDELIDRIHSRRLYERNMDILRTALSTCVQLAKGDAGLLKAFLGVQHINTRAINEARIIYRNLDIEEFFDWASDHFGLDDYYSDADALVEHLQDIIKDDGLLLVKDELYSLMADMVNRSGIHADLLADV